MRGHTGFWCLHTFICALAESQLGTGLVRSRRAAPRLSPPRGCCRAVAHGCGSAQVAPFVTSELICGDEGTECTAFLVSARVPALLWACVGTHLASPNQGAFQQTDAPGTRADAQAAPVVPRPGGQRARSSNAMLKAAPPAGCVFLACIV